MSSCRVDFLFCSLKSLVFVRFRFFFLEMSLFILFFRIVFVSLAIIDVFFDYCWRYNTYSIARKKKALRAFFLLAHLDDSCVISIANTNNNALWALLLTYR